MWAACYGPRSSSAACPNAMQRALADRALREEQRDTWDWLRLERWAGATACKTLELAARNAVALLRSGWASTTPGVWAERFQLLLRCSAGLASGRSRVSSIKLSRNSTTRSRNSGRSAPSCVRCRAGEALASLSRPAADTPFEPETEAAPVTVIDIDTVAGMQFDALWVDRSRGAALAAADASRSADPARAAARPACRRASALHCTVARAIAVPALDA